MNNYLITSILDGAVVKFADSIDGLLLYQRGDRWHWELTDRRQSSEDKYRFARDSGFDTALEALSDVIEFLIPRCDYGNSSRADHNSR